MSIRDFFQAARDILFGNEVMPGCLAWPVIFGYGLWLLVKSWFVDDAAKKDQ